MKIKRSPIFAFSTVLALAMGAGDGTDAAADTPGTAPCAALAAATFARVPPRYAGSGSLEDGTNFTCVTASAPGSARAAAPVRGIDNWIHSTDDAERASPS